MFPNSPTAEEDHEIGGHERLTQRFSTRLDPAELPPSLVTNFRGEVLGQAVPAILLQAFHE